MSAYLDIVQALAREIKSISITLKTMNDIRHVDTLSYLATTLEDDLPRKISIETLKAQVSPGVIAT